MCTCLRQTFCLPNKFFISSRTSSLKYFSALSAAHNKFSSNYDRNKLIIKKINPPNKTQHKNFSLVQNIQSFYGSVRASEACKFTNQLLIDTHDLSGLPWFFTIIAASAVLKLFVSLPAGIFQQHLVSKLELTKSELDGRVPALKKRVFKRAVRLRLPKSKVEAEFRRELREEWRYLIVKNNCHPFKATILFFVQFPFWLILTVAIRSFANDVYTNTSGDVMSALQFTVGGPFWCKNLALPDPTYVLPVINFLTLLACNEISYATKAKVAENISAVIIHKIMPNFARLLAVAFLFISAVSPSALSLFWATNSVLALSQHLLLMSPRVRRFLRIPKTRLENARPYMETWNSIVGKWRTLFSRNN